MRIRSILSWFCTAALALAFASCNKDHFNINKNPNQPTDSTVSYDVILPAALNNTGAAVAGNWGWLQNWMGYWARSGSYAPNFNEETYTITTTFQTGIWNDLYNNAYDYEVMRLKASQNNAAFYEGIARIMKAHNFQILVDVYNNVPYSEALKAGANVTPRYDKGIDIYRDLFRQIDTGITLIRTATATQSRNIATNDIMFAGNKTLWAKFGNTIKLRMLLHLHNGLATSSVATGIDVPAEVAKITAEGSGFLGAGETANVQPGYRSDKPNPFYRVYSADEAGTVTQASAYYRANEWGLDYYAFKHDPREALFYSAVNGNYRGVPYGLPAATENGSTFLSGIGAGLNKRNSMPQWIITATESLFLQAEARQRGIIAGPTAKSLWEAAISENFVWLGSTAAAAQSFIASHANSGEADADFDANPMYAILSQKWFALNGVAPYEIWSDLRRTGIVYGVQAGYVAGPPLSVAPANTATRIPTRLLYPQTEYNYNAANVQKEGSVERYGRVFWDLN